MKITLYILIAILFIAIVLVFTGNKTVSHKITINAAANNVWAVLMDVDTYKEWNPVMQLNEGIIKEGEIVKYQFTQAQDNSYEIPIKVVKIEPNQLLNQKGGIPMVLTYNHQYILKELGNKTEVEIKEQYKGLYVNFWNPKPVEAAYKRLNEALKNRVEALN